MDYLSAIQWVQFATVLFSGLAILFSYRSNRKASEANNLSHIANHLSKEANKISEETVKLVRENFKLENRPHLNLEIIKYEDRKTHVVLEPNEKILTVIIQLKLTNEGKTPAQNIALPETIGFMTNMAQTIRSFTYNIPNLIDLGPNQSQKINNTLTLGFEDQDPKKLKEDFEKELWFLNLPLTVTYTGTLDPSAKYKTFVNYQIKNSGALLLERKME